MKTILNSIDELTQIMCGLENIKINTTDIKKVCNKEKVNSINSIEYRKIYQFYSTCIKIFNSNQKINFYNILSINEELEWGLNINCGEFRKNELMIDILGKKITIPPYNVDKKKKEFDKLIDKLAKQPNIDIKQEVILNFCLETTTDKCFFTGNIKTMLIVCNKLLFDYCYINQNTFLTNFDLSVFFNNLNLFFLEKYSQVFFKEKKHKQQMMFFLQNILKNNQQEKIIFDKDNFDIVVEKLIDDFGICENELIELSNNEGLKNVF